MKSLVTIFGAIVVICSLGFVLVHYQRSGTSQDGVFLALNETIKTEVTANISRGESRKEAGVAYLNIPKFEETVRAKLSKPIGSKLTDKKVFFRYLTGENNRMKAIQAKINAEDGKEYQTTIVVDIHSTMTDKKE